MAAFQDFGRQKRLRVDSNSTGHSGSEDEPSPKKDKTECVDADCEVDKVAILDAGAQYGKVRCSHTLHGVHSYIDPLTAAH